MSERTKELPSRRGKAFDKKSVHRAVVKGLSGVSITGDTEHLGPGAWDPMQCSRVGHLHKNLKELHFTSHTSCTVQYARYGLVYSNHSATSLNHMQIHTVLWKNDGSNMLFTQFWHNIFSKFQKHLFVHDFKAGITHNTLLQRIRS